MKRSGGSDVIVSEIRAIEERQHEARDSGPGPMLICVDEGPWCRLEGIRLRVRGGPVVSLEGQLLKLAEEKLAEVVLAAGEFHSCARCGSTCAEDEDLCERCRKELEW